MWRTLCGERSTRNSQHCTCVHGALGVEECGANYESVPSIRKEADEALTQIISISDALQVISMRKNAGCMPEAASCVAARGAPCIALVSDG